MEWNEYVDKIKILFSRTRIEFSSVEESLQVTLENRTFIQTKQEYDDLITKIKKKSADNTSFFDKNSYETLITEISDSPHLSFLVRKLPSISDPENDVKYELSLMSDDYLTYMLNNINIAKIPKRFNPRRDILDEVEATDTNLLTLVKSLLRYNITVKIFGTNKTKEDFLGLFDSYKFQLAFNLDLVIGGMYDFEFSYFDNPNTRRRIPLNQMVAPKMQYNLELTNQYYMGVSSRIPFVEFISYYHVLEYFFEKIYHDDLIKTLQEKINSPRFSIKREKDVTEIIRFISKKVRDRNESYDINELEALELVLIKYINVPDLTESLSSIDQSLIDYYKNSIVPFSKGDTIDFDDYINPKIYKKIAARIYKTRNSIVHSKSGIKTAYSPFNDDGFLSKEIPLLRLIAEEVIIKTARFI